MLFLAARQMLDLTGCETTTLSIFLEFVTLGEERECLYAHIENIPNVVLSERKCKTYSPSFPLFCFLTVSAECDSANTFEILFFFLLYLNGSEVVDLHNKFTSVLRHCSFLALTSVKRWEFFFTFCTIAFDQLDLKSEFIQVRSKAVPSSQLLVNILPRMTSLWGGSAVTLWLQCWDEGTLPFCSIFKT